MKSRLIEDWYRRDSFIYKNFHYLFENELWKTRVPDGFSVCPYFWLSMFSLLVFRPIAVVVHRLIRPLFRSFFGKFLQPVDRWFYHACDDLNEGEYEMHSGLGLMAILASTPVLAIIAYFFYSVSVSFMPDIHWRWNPGMNFAEMIYVIWASTVTLLLCLVLIARRWFDPFFEAKSTLKYYGTALVLVTYAIFWRDTKVILTGLFRTAWTVTLCVTDVVLPIIGFVLLYGGICILGLAFVRLVVLGLDKLLTKRANPTEFTPEVARKFRLSTRLADIFRRQEGVYNHLCKLVYDHVLDVATKQLGVEKTKIRGWESGIEKWGLYNIYCNNRHDLMPFVIHKLLRPVSESLAKAECDPEKFKADTRACSNFFTEVLSAAWNSKGNRNPDYLMVLENIRVAFERGTLPKYVWSESDGSDDINDIIDAIIGKYRELYEVTEPAKSPSRLHVVKQMISDEIKKAARLVAVPVRFSATLFSYVWIVVKSIKTKACPYIKFK